MDQNTALHDQLAAFERKLREGGAQAVEGTSLADALASAREGLERYESTLLKLKGSFTAISRASDTKATQQEAKKAMTDLLRAGV